MASTSTTTANCPPSEGRATTVDSAAIRRQVPLQRPLEALQSAFDTSPVSVGIRSLNVAGLDAPFEVDPWCVEPFRRFAAAGTIPQDDPIAVLVGQSLGLAVKARGDLGAIGAHGDHRELRYAIEAELMLDAAVGLALVRELRAAINLAVQEADRDRASGLTRLMNETRRLVVLVKTSLAEVEHERVESLAGALTDTPADTRPAGSTRAPSGAAGAIDPQRAGWQRVLVLGTRKARRDDPWLPSRRSVLVVALLSCLAVWSAITILPGLRRPSLDLVRSSEIIDARQFESVDARVSSMFLTVDPGRWAAWSSAERHATLERVAGVLRERGYSGMFVRLTDGTAAGRWLADRGVELIERPVVDPGAPQEPQRVHTLGFVF